MITSKDNEKLKLVRALGRRESRRREQRFVSEGEDLLAAGLAAGHVPEFVLVTPDSGLRGEKVLPDLLESVSTLGSGSRAIAVWPQIWADASEIGEEGLGPVCVFLDGVADPGNVGTIIRTKQALADGAVVVGPNTADPYSPKAVRASMGAIFAQTMVRGGVFNTPAPRLAMVAHGGAPLDSETGALTPDAGAITVCLGAEREGVSPTTLAACEDLRTIRLRDAAVESLNVAAAAAIILARVAVAGEVVKTGTGDAERGASEHAE